MHHLRVCCDHQMIYKQITNTHTHTHIFIVINYSKIRVGDLKLLCAFIANTKNQPCNRDYLEITNTE